MLDHEEAVCAICGANGWGDQRWFLVVENHWNDKLKVLHWNEALAWQPGIRQVCSSGHVRELVVHWMTTGCLDYPFALSPFQNPARRRKVFRALRPVQLPDSPTDNARQIGEIAIHRESMQRILRENPQALGGILDALLVAMAHSRSQDPQNLALDMELCTTYMEV
jgi:hypothetical protein